MRITELRRRMAEHFGADWAPSYAKDFVMAELGGQTVDQALAMGAIGYVSKTLGSRSMIASAVAAASQWWAARRWM